MTRQAEQRVKESRHAKDRWIDIFVFHFPPSGPFAFGDNDAPNEQGLPPFMTGERMGILMFEIPLKSQASKLCSHAAEDPLMCLGTTMPIA